MAMVQVRSVRHGTAGGQHVFEFMIDKAAAAGLGAVSFFGVRWLYGALKND